MLGRVVLSGKLDANGSLDVSRLPAGHYVLTIRTAQGQTTRKISKR